MPEATGIWYIEFRFSPLIFRVKFFDCRILRPNLVNFSDLFIFTQLALVYSFAGSRCSMKTAVEDG